MAVKKSDGGLNQIEPTNKKTCIGRRNVKTSSMNKSAKRSYKKYRGQG